MADIQLWPEPIIELNKELATGYHPKLEAALAAIGGGESEFIERFGTIAAYCDVALDGMYTSDQMVAMVEGVILDRLKARREQKDSPIVIY